MATSSEVTSALADITLTRPETRMSRARGQTNLMLESRNARKRAEADVQLLANRLQHLKFEEQRANAKIDETRTRTQQVLELQSRNNKIQDTKMTNNLETNLHISHEKMRLKAVRARSVKQIADSKAMVFNQKRKQATSQREQLRKLSDFKERQRRAVEDRNRKKTHDVRRQEQAFRARREAERQEHQQRLQQEYSRRLQEESHRQQHAEDLVRKMEQEERDIIERLESTQDIQRSAYQELQSTLLQS